MNKWIKPRDCESWNCPEVMVQEDRVGIRNSENPDVVAWFSGKDWVEMVAEMRSEHPFGVTADLFG